MAKKTVNYFKELNQILPSPVTERVIEICTQNPSLGIEEGELLEKFLRELYLYQEYTSVHLLRQRSIVENCLKEIKAKKLQDYLKLDFAKLKKLDSRIEEYYKRTLFMYEDIADFTQRTDLLSKEEGIPESEWWRYPVSNKLVTLEDFAKTFGQ